MKNSIKGVANPVDLLDQYSSTVFIISQFIKNNINTIELVKVEAINEDGSLNVSPAVKRETADGTYAENGIIPNVKYIQYQAGTNAVIVKPQVGDIGLLLINKRDISNAQGGIVATNRMFNPCDGIYLGGVFGLNQNPFNYIEVNDSGIIANSGLKINLKATVGINMDSPLVETTGSLKVGTGASGMVYTGAQALTFVNGILTSIE